jgi:hypothetical protein
MARHQGKKMYPQRGTKYWDGGKDNGQDKAMEQEGCIIDRSLVPQARSNKFVANQISSSNFYSLSKGRFNQFATTKRNTP